MIIYKSRIEVKVSMDMKDALQLYADQTNNKLSSVVRFALWEFLIARDILDPHTHMVKHEVKK